jgi:hypothetical protein
MLRNKGLHDLSKVQYSYGADLCVAAIGWACKRNGKSRECIQNFDGELQVREDDERVQ